MKFFLAQRLLLTLFLLTLTFRMDAQYYYQDIYSTLQTNANHELYKKNNVKRLVVKSMDASLNSDNDFLCERTLSPDYTLMRSITRSNATGASVLTSFFNLQGEVIKTVDSSNSSINTTLYHYDANGRIMQIEFMAQGIGEKNKTSETHDFVYDTASHLQQLVRRKNNRHDSVIVRFKTNQKGQVTEEQESGRNFVGPRIYYNYDKQGRLTDILRYNARAGRLLPDYMFEYDSNNRLSQMMTVLDGSSNYTIWKYFYDDRGLSTKEECYEKGKRLLGLVKYSYEFKGQ